MALPFSLTEAYRATLGLIVLQSDETLEPESRRALPDDIALYHSRIPSALEVTTETLAEMEANLPEAARLLPQPARFDAIGFACTSGATVIGQDKVAAAIRQHHPGATVTDPITAVVAALTALNVRRIGLVTPYATSVSAAMQVLLTANGFNITAFGSFEQETEATVARIDEQSTLAALCDVGAGDVDAVFTSCTNLRSFGIIETAEARLGKPVISSNSALIWHLLRLAGAQDSSGPGRLFAL